jgi:hypothetical protein
VIAATLLLDRLCDRFLPAIGRRRLAKRFFHGSHSVGPGQRAAGADVPRRPRPYVLT